jgi:triosephosphate isomerase
LADLPAKNLSGKVSAGKEKSPAEVVICPPAIFLPELAKLNKNKRVILGAQDGATVSIGSLTGSISFPMVKSVGATLSIIGHSECRKRGDSDEMINQKIKLALKTGLRVVLCIGEKEHSDDGEYLKELKNQLHLALAGIPKNNFKNLLIAHEPVWAIGAEATGADTPDSFSHNRLFIKKVLSDLSSPKIMAGIPILYGGSVNKDNAESFLNEGQADGLLIGRESLRAANFLKIINLVK